MIRIVKDGQSHYKIQKRVMLFWWRDEVNAFFNLIFAIEHAVINYSEVLLIPKQTISDRA